MPIIESPPVDDITVQYVNFPKEGKRLGSIKSSEGHYYWGTPDQLRQFTRGMVCKVEYKKKTDDNGKEWRTINRVIGSTAAAPPANNFRARSNPAEAKQIAVLAIIKEWVHQIPAGDEDALVNCIQAAMRAYDRTLGGVTAQRRDDMNDEIPI